ncbi:MAG: hypothetical protein WC782_05360 [Methylococcaceae bacterium]
MLNKNASLENLLSGLPRILMVSQNSGHSSVSTLEVHQHYLWQ